MELQIAEVVSISCQLTDIGFPITDQLLASAIRVKLPESWDTLKMVLANTGGTGQSSKGVISQILAEEHHCVHAMGGDATAYYAKSALKRKKKKVKKCSYCNNKGHIASECCKCEHEERSSGLNLALNTSNGRLLGKSLSSKSLLGKLSSGKSLSRMLNSKATNSAKIAAADSDSNSDSDETVQVFMACTATNENIKHIYKTKAKLCQCNLQHGWLIDLGTSQTMCLHQTWFSHFTPLSRHTKVVLGDNSTIPAIGTGCLNVRMFAKGRWINSVLQDILYVLDLYGNLLSISHLMRHDAKVCFLGEDCHVYDQCKSLILEGGLCNNLYIIKMQVANLVATNIAILDTHSIDATLPPDCALIICLTLSIGSPDLWHHCLGHLHTNAITHMV